MVIFGWLLNQLTHEISSFTFYNDVAFIPRPKTIEEKIVQELGEEFVAIGYCESSLRQFNENGEVLISHSSDKGVLQINQIHWETAEKMGIDLDTVDGNIAYAKYLKERNGKNDWYQSAHCWKPLLAMNI